MQSLDLIKKRIRSIEATKKITNAMKLVATTKLRSQRKLFEAASAFCTNYYEVFKLLVAKNGGLDQYKRIKNKDHSFLYILITSDLGLCGAYNSNVCKFLANMLKPQDKVLVFGQKGVSWLKAHHFGKQIARSLHWNISNNTYHALLPLGVEVVETYMRGKYEKIRLVFTAFESTMKYQPVVWDLLPINTKYYKDENKILTETSLYEPKAEEIIFYIIDSYISNNIYGALVSSAACELYSRRFAMEAATKSATDLINQLKVEYNQARQEAITQEINEIIAGAAGKIK